MYKRHRREFKRLFKSILGRHQGASAAFVPLRHFRHSTARSRSANGSADGVPFFYHLNSSFSKAHTLIVDVLLVGAHPKRGISAPWCSRVVAGAKPDFAGAVGFNCCQMRNIWCTLHYRWLRTEPRPTGPFCEVTMKCTIFAGVLLTVGSFSLPILAQQQDLQEVMNATNALGAREGELLGKKDAAGIAALFTSDGLLVMLAPQLAFKPGREAIQKHYQGIIDAGATGITLELKNLELRGNDGVWAAGNYSVTVKDNAIQGSWFRILKRESGAWKIAMEAFARAGGIDVPPGAATPSPAPANK